MDTEVSGTGRPSRREETAQGRRRRGEDTLAAAKRLPIPPEVEARLKAQGRVPRWVNDTSNRIHNLTVLDDYDKVDGVEPVPVVVNRKTGETVMAHLLSKPAEFIREDRAKADERLRETEEALFRRPDATDSTAKGRNPHPASAERYVDKATSLSRGGNQILEG